MRSFYHNLRNAKYWCDTEVNTLSKHCLSNEKEQNREKLYIHKCMRVKYNVHCFKHINVRLLRHASLYIVNLSSVFDKRLG